MKIAVVVPVYNGQEYLRQCLESIKSQSYQDIQVIVCDNESSDNTWEIMQEYSDVFKLLKTKNIYKHSWDDSLEEAFKHFDEDVEYFTIIAHDDSIECDYIKNNAIILEMLPERIKMIQSPIKCFGASNEILRNEIYDLEQYKSALLQRCVVTTPSVFYHKSLSEIWYAKPEQFAGASDYYRYLKFADLGFVVLAWQGWIGYNYRIHPGQATWAMHREYSQADSEIQAEFREKWLNNDSE